MKLLLMVSLIIVEHFSPKTNKMTISHKYKPQSHNIMLVHVWHEKRFQFVLTWNLQVNYQSYIMPDIQT